MNKSATTWRCHRCGETNQPQFVTCWYCKARNRNAPKLKRRGKGRVPGSTRAIKEARADVPTESQHQIALVQWWTLYAATHKIDPRLLMSSQAGAHLAGDARRRAIAVARMKREGWQAGVPDLMLAIPRPGVFAGMFLELKRIGGKLEPHQADYHDLLRRSGYNCVTCYGADECIRAITAYLEA